MAEAIKFTETEAKSINDLRLDVSTVFTQLGQISIEKKNRISEMEAKENELMAKHVELQKLEQELFTTLNTKYGDGNYDPATGDFTPLASEEITE